MVAIRRFSTALTMTWAWKNPKYLRVERRFDGRVKQPQCFVFADREGGVGPVVYFFPSNLHPDMLPLPMDAIGDKKYEDIDALVADGWSPFSDDDLNLGLSF
jgi:hypothetical protein